MSPKSSVIVRRAAAEDIPSLSAIGSEAFSEAYASFNTANDISAHIQSQYSLAAIRQEMELPDRFYLVALFDDAPAGLCKLRAGPVPKDIPDSASLEIQQLYINPRHQRLGIGTALVDAVFDEARTSGLNGVWLSVWQQAPWATNFYSKCGFTRFGVHTFQLGSAEQSDLLMWIGVN